MTDVEKNRIQEIVSLHQEIGEHLKLSLKKAIKIGKLLTEQKENLRHGEFTPWIKVNLPFTDRTARNYMRLYREKARLKTETVSVLTDAYRLLTEPKPLTGTEEIIHCYADLVNRVKEEVETWEEAFQLVSDKSTIPVKHLIRWHWYFFGDSSGLQPESLTEKDMDELAEAFARIGDKVKKSLEHDLV